MDPFQQALNLEELYSLAMNAPNDRYYKQGYDEGYEDGLKSGPEEGFDFGHEVSFQKFLHLGVLLGRCAIWKSSLSSPSARLSPAKKTRAIKQVALLEEMILALDKDNETEEEHGKFEEMKRKIISKSRVVESLMGEERSMSPSHETTNPEEDHIALAKRMDRELQL